MTGWMDTHCHLCLLKAEQGTVPEVLSRAREAGVQRVLDVATGPDNWACVMAHAHAHDSVYAAVGVHPTSEATEVDWARLDSLASDARVLAIGECGLDFYHEPESACGHQYERFERQIALAIALGKPLIIHTRTSSAQTLAMLKACGAEAVGGIMHCFVEDREVARQALDLGFHVSFSGIATFKKADVVHDTVRWVPLDRLLIETDAPYLAPVPYRGKLNEPAFVAQVGAQVAALKGVSPEVLAQQLEENARRLFGLTA